MKVSLSWVFDHIDSDWKKHSVKEIVSLFNQITAEIEGYHKVKIDLSKFFICKINGDKGHIPELNQDVSLEFRKDAVQNNYYLVKQRKDKNYAFVTCKDVGLDKDGILPPFDVTEKDLKGKWRDEFESEDVIFDIDNKSLTHRPDMWGHRGIAREIAAILKLPFLPKKDFLAKRKVDLFDKENKSTGNYKFNIEIQSPKSCSRFSGLYFNKIENNQSHLCIASRLIKIGTRPINAIVDLTNYVMLDWSQPVHSYDSENISGNTIIARLAESKEALTLLDDSELKLNNQDIVIADSKKLLGLGGVMGGKYSSINEKTKSIFFESANFDPTYVRRTALRNGIRTESSARFEKTLDPNQITDAILRFIFLCDEIGIKTDITENIVCIGKPFEEKSIGILHSFLEKKSGVKLTKENIIEPLQRLGFEISESSENLGDIKDTLYKIKVPSYRGAKDVQIKEDILEEIIRFFGFNKIALDLPSIKKKPSDLTPIFRLRKIKEFLAHCGKMTEQQNYIYYDEIFLDKLGLKSKNNNCLEIVNPVSENNVRLVSALIPGLLKNIDDNFANENSLRFFECGNTFRTKKDSTTERKTVAGIFFEKKQEIDFYEFKQIVDDLLGICLLKGIFWKKITGDYKEYPWAMPYQSAELLHENTRIGVAGKLCKTFLSKLDDTVDSDAFFFELDGDRMLNYHEGDVKYCPISKYQDVKFDMSFMVPSTLTAYAFQNIILDCDDMIEKVELVDFFEKEEWVNERSLAFRIWVGDPERTLKKEDIDSVRENILQEAKKVDAILRQ